MIDPQRDKPRGRWKKVDGTLVGGGEQVVPPELELLRVPYKLPAEYDTTLILERTRAATVGLPAADPAHVFTVFFAGPCQFEFLLDANIGPAGATVHGLSRIDNVPYHQNATKRVGPFFDARARVRVEWRVRQGSVKVLLNREEWIDWKGDPSRLTIDRDRWGGGVDRNCLAVGVRFAEYRIHEWTLTPK